MFYPKDGEHSIEPNYLIPVVRTSSEIKTYNHTPQSYGFSTNKTIPELESNGDSGALEWINKFRYANNSSGRPLTEVLPTSKELWYQMSSEGALADFGTSINPYKRIFWTKFDDRSFVDQRIIGLSVKDNYRESCNKDLLLALLNSIISITLIEAAGFGRGLGALDLNKNNVSKTYILNPDILNETQKENIIDKFNAIGDEVAEITTDDLNTEEREIFDRYVLSCYDIEEHYEDIKLTFIKMISNRLQD